MKHWLLGALLAASIPSIAAATGDEIEVVSAGSTSILAVGDTYFNANFNGWNISASAFPTAVAPGFGPFSLQVLASCSSGNCLTNPLDVFFTAQNYTTPIPAGGFQTGYTAGTAGAAGVTTRAITWADNTDTPFGGGLPTGIMADHLGTVTLNPLPAGPVNFGAAVSGSAVGGPPEGPTPYSLTIEEAFTANTSGATFFNADGNVSAAPEIDPASAMGCLTLLAGGLAALRGRRGTKQ